MPTTAQGASRRARTTERLRVAVTEQLLQRGYAGVTIEGVAAASGVAKTTIYRRWPSKAEMVFELEIHQIEQAPPIDTGSLEGDVALLAQQAVTLIASELGKRVLPGLLAEMSSDADLATRLRTTFIEPAKADIDTILSKAQARGELRHTVVSEEFHAALLGIPYAHVHLLADGNSTELTEQLTKQLLALLPVVRG